MMKLESKGKFELMKRRSVKHTLPNSPLKKVFDGHGGKAAAQFVRNHLPRIIVEATDFPLQLEKVVTRSFMITGSEFEDSCSLESSLSSGTTALTAMIFGRFANLVQISVSYIPHFPLRYCRHQLKCSFSPDSFWDFGVLAFIINECSFRFHCSFSPDFSEENTLHVKRSKAGEITVLELFLLDYTHQQTLLLEFINGIHVKLLLLSWMDYTEQSSNRHTGRICRSRIDQDSSRITDVHNYHNYRIFIDTWNVGGRCPPT